MKYVCVFCGSSSGQPEAYANAARTLGAQMAATGLTLVYGGGNVGLMGTLADACLASGAHVIGVIPEHLVSREVAHHGVSKLIRVNSMHERKRRMVDLSDSFLTLPGGIGTMDEFFEVFTWRQLGLHHKPIGMLNVEGFFDPLLQLLDQMIATGFLKSKNRDQLHVDDDPAKLLEVLAAASQFPHPEKTSRPAKA
jgi:uncharacterized protein (TIGR00730 family)